MVGATVDGGGNFVGWLCFCGFLSAVGLAAVSAEYRKFGFG
jgi:hypothetical protein